METVFCLAVGGSPLRINCSHSAVRGSLAAQRKKHLQRGAFRGAVIERACRARSRFPTLRQRRTIRRKPYDEIRVFDFLAITDLQPVKFLSTLSRLTFPSFAQKREVYNLVSF